MTVEKKQHTLKNTVMSLPNKFIVFVGRTFSGHNHDYHIPTASFNSLSNVLVLKGVVTARSWLTEGTLQWSWDPCPLPPQVIELSVVKLRSENYFLLQKLWHWFSVMGTFLPFEIITYAI